jgi:hypothetical protein
MQIFCPTICTNPNNGVEFISRRVDVLVKCISVRRARLLDLLQVLNHNIMKCAVAIPYLTHDEPQAHILFLIKFLDSFPIIFNMRVLGNLTNSKY